MTRKRVYKLFSAVSFILLACINSYAVDAVVTPQEIKPGDVFLLSVEAAPASRAEAAFRGKKIPLYAGPDNRLVALVPVGIDTPPGRYDVTVKRGKGEIKIPVIVVPHKFRTIKLTLPEEKVTLSPENQKRAAREAARLKKIWPESTARAWAGQFVPPTDTEISEVFGVKRIMNEKKTSVHRGMDFRGKTGTPVRAINAGRVVLEDELFFGGNTLIIDHGTGLYSVYMHLSRFNVKEGEKVSAGQTIGFIGSSGRVTGPHLHMSVRLKGVSVNPESLFALQLHES
ncbi:MAG: M23 family metallopeptidase [Deferribacteres bacterium]|nr:M23 family metallopeptidase [Deferribacteres bacterium]